MVEIAKKGYVSPFAVHPGETIREALEFADMSQVDLAARVELSEKTISLILNGLEPVTPESALKFERVLGLSQQMLLKMQAYYEADRFRLEEKARLEKEAALLPNFFCYSELVKLNFVEKTKDKLKQVEELLRFFRVNSLFSIPKVFPAAFRISDKNTISDESLAAWLRIGVIKAQEKDLPEFNRERLIKNIEKMRSLTTRPAKEYSQLLVELCAEAGVSLVYTPHLKKTCANGASQWISPTRALVQVSLYRAYADIFWFTLFHELGHILKHSKKETFINFTSFTEAEKAEAETEANLFAQQLIIPENKENEYQLLKQGLNKLNCISRINRFSESLNLDPGIVAGRLAKEMGIWRYVYPLRKRLVFTD